MPRPSLLRPSSLLALLAPALLSLPAAAQGGAVWVALDNHAAGSPAELSLLPALSTTDRTTAELTIHGFWREDVLGPDGVTYQRLDFPGLETLPVPGAPLLPSLRTVLGVVTDATAAVPTFPVVTGQAFVSGIRPLPAPTTGEDEEFDPTWDPGPGDTQGVPEQWTLDTGIYSGAQGLWPAIDITGGPVVDQLGGLPGAAVSVNPVVWDPTSNRLIVKTGMQFGWDHGGLEQASRSLNKLAHQQFEAHVLNWQELGSIYQLEPWVYHARYLIVAQPWWWDTLEPFVALKQQQGYEVTVVAHLPDVASVRGAIGDWYAQGNPAMDHYALLVGDAELIPLGSVTVDGTAVKSDDVYGTVGAVDGSKEVHVGRLSIDNEADLANQLAKIIAYQTAPVPGGRYDHALLVAHEEEYPDKYSASHTRVLTNSYSHPPFFLASFGGTGGTNAQVTNFIDNGSLGGGLGLVAYRGHGSTSTWSGWNLADENWHSNNVMLLDNPLRPIVWSIACTNANLDFEFGTGQDSIAEVWMEVADGAVASYAATQSTSTTPNHHLNEKLFKVVFDQGVTTHALALELAEASLWSHWPGHKNPWSYLLLGDPSMVIRRDQAVDLQVSALPASFSLDFSGETSLQALLSTTAAPPEDGLISFHKASFLGGGEDEHGGAYWLNESGEATVPLWAETPGVLHVMVRDLDGNVFQHGITVTLGEAWTDLGQALPAAGAEPLRLAGTGPLSAGSQARLLLAGAEPGSTVWMAYGSAALNAPFKGGVLVPDIAPPGAVLPLATDEHGDLDLATTWPGGFPSGSELVFQAWAADAAGPVGWIASNGLLATTP